MKITLRAARINTGLTQKEAANQLGISRNTLASYELYKTKPDIEMAKQMSNLYGLPVDGIIFCQRVVLKAQYQKLAQKHFKNFR